MTIYHFSYLVTPRAALDEAYRKKYEEQLYKDYLDEYDKTGNISFANDKDWTPWHMKGCGSIEDFLMSLLNTSQVKDRNGNTLYYISDIELRLATLEEIVEHDIFYKNFSVLQTPITMEDVLNASLKNTPSA